MNHGVQQKTSVLVVEDEQMLSDVYRRVLESRGMDVASAHNGKEALAIIYEGLQPDIILLDLRMPVMDGIAFLKELQPRTNLPKTKIIVFSNYDNQAEINEAFGLGAIRYMLKAWATPDELVKLIHEVSAATTTSRAII